MILDYPQIGKNLAKRRKELKLKQYEVCERAEINDKYLSCIETARSIPSLEVFLRLCTALETTPDRILFGTVRQTDYTKDSTILLEKFQRLSPNNKRLCLAFMDLLSKNNLQPDAKNSRSASRRTAVSFSKDIFSVFRILTSNRRYGSRMPPDLLPAYRRSAVPGHTAALHTRPALRYRWSGVPSDADRWDAPD